MHRRLVVSYNLVTRDTRPWGWPLSNQWPGEVRYEPNDSDCKATYRNEVITRRGKGSLKMPLEYSGAVPFCQSGDESKKRANRDHREGEIDQKSYESAKNPGQRESSFGRRREHQKKIQSDDQ
jgi:hypothetical protein